MTTALADRLQAAGVVAVLRGPDPRSAVAAADRLIGTGIGAVEVTFTIPRAHEAIAELVARHGDGALIGAGTLTAVPQVELAARAGACFLVSPGTQADLLDAMRATRALAIPGAMTPSEVMQAVRGGADAVKLFPAGALGPAYLRSLRAPFPGVRFVPTGGVSPENASRWLDAGAFALGAGSELCSDGDVAAGRLDVIAERARRFAAAIERAGRSVRPR